MYSTFFQVQILLKHIGLQKYKDMFQSEDITGDLFVELTDDMLEHNLGVTSRLHRLKLNRLISGKKSAMDVLQRENEA